MTLTQNHSEVCQRCAVWCDREDYKPVPATTYQEYRRNSDEDYWPNQVTVRCDACAVALRQYCALPKMGVRIVIDRPLGIMVRSRRATNA